MPRKRHSTEQVIAKLREADVQLAKGASVGEICRALGISEHTYYRWRKAYGGMVPSQARRLKEMEQENTRLKKLVADLCLDKSILEEALEKKP